MLRRTPSGVVAALVALALAGIAGPVAAVSTPTSVTLTWTAPGDDSLTGTATQYDVRWSTSPITAGNFGSATAASGAPSPQASGSTETMLVNGLSPATTYWFAVRTRDDAGNWSLVSNIVQWTTPSAADTVRPAPLAVQLAGSTASSVSLSWTASGDDSLTGNATQYDVRWSTSPITPANWSGATRVTNGVPTPGTPGAVQGCTITGLNRTVDLWFAVRVADEVNNWSVASNVIMVPLMLDAAPPATPSGLVVSRDDAGVHLNWNANGEADLAGYHVYRTTTQGGAFMRLDASLLASSTYTDAALPDSDAVWYAVSAVDVNQNESAHSGAVVVWLHAAGIVAVHLDPAYPNPSSIDAPVSLPVDVPAGGIGDGRLDITNAAGERVRTMDVGSLSPGTHVLTWDGRNDAGRLTAPGVYRAMLIVGSNAQVVRLVRKP